MRTETALARQSAVVIDPTEVESSAPDQESPPKGYEKAWAILDRQVSDDNIDAVIGLRGTRYKVSTLQYLKMTKMALLEIREQEMTAKDIAIAVGVAPTTAMGLRKRDAYQQIKADIVSKIKDLALPRKLSDHVADVEMQDQLARAMRRRALHGKGPVAASNTAALADRAMPVKQQIDTMSVQVVIQASTLEEAERTKYLMAKAGLPLEVKSKVVEEKERLS